MSIGRDYLRFNGSSISADMGCDDVIVEGCLGAGTCSTVWKASIRKRRRRGGGGGGGGGCQKVGALGIGGGC